MRKIKQTLHRFEWKLRTLYVKQLPFTGEAQNTDSRVRLLGFKLQLCHLAFPPLRASVFSSAKWDEKKK